MPESLTDILGPQGEPLTDILGPQNEPLDSILKDTPPSYGEVAASILPVGGALIQQSVGGAFRQSEREGRELREQIDLQGIGAFDPLSPTHKQLLSRPEGASEELGRDIATKARQKRQEETPENMTFWQRALHTAGTSMVQAATLAPAIAIRSPKLAAGAAAFGIGELSFNREYDEGLSQGLAPEDAMRRAVINGHIFEGVTELFPAKALVANTGLFKKFVNFMAAELPGEGVAEVGQMFTDYLYNLRGEPTVGEIGETLLEVGAAVMLGGGAQVGLATGAQKLLGRKDVKIEPEPEEEITGEEEESLDKILEDRPPTEGIEVGEATPEEFEAVQDSFATEPSEVDALVGARPPTTSAEFAEQHLERAFQINQEMAIRGAVEEPFGPVTGLAVARQVSEDAKRDISGRRLGTPVLERSGNAIGAQLSDKLTITQTARQGQMLEKVANADLQPGQVVEAWEPGRTKEEQTIGRAAINSVSRWARSYMPDAKIVLVSPKSYRDATGYTVERGMATIDDNTGTLFISYRPTVHPSSSGSSPKAEVFTTIGHEFGHSLIFQQLPKAQKSVRNALLNEHKRYVERAMTQPAIEWAQEFLSPAIFNAWKNTRGIETMTGLEFMDSLYDRGHRPHGRHPANYYFNFDEFMAQSFARYAATREAPFAEVEGFWKQVMATLRKFFKENISKFTPNTTAEMWFEQLATQAYLDTLPSSAIQDSITALTARQAEDIATERIDDTTSAMAMDLPEEHNQAKMNTFIKNMFNLTQVAGENTHIPGVTNYTENVRDWWADKSKWTQRANERLGEWKLSKKDSAKFNEAVFAITLESDRLGRALTAEEKRKAFLDAELDSPAAEDLFEKLSKDFKAAVEELFDVLLADARKRFANNAAALTELETRYAKEKAQLLDRDYFPLTRFGKYWVRVRAARPVKYRGVRFGVNETIAYEMFETEREMERRKRQLEGQFPGQLIGGSRLSDVARPFFGMPKQLVEHFLDRIDTFGEFSEKQKDEIRLELGILEHETAPSQSYKKHLLHRKGIAGFSFDARRVYANYFMHFANHISRSKYAYPLSQARGQVADHAKRMEEASIPGRTAVKERLLSDYIEEHYDYVMNPGNELANLRSMGFLWYLGFLPKSAMINLTQVPMVALPYLSQQYGDAKTVVELTRAGKDIRKLFRSASSKDSGLKKWEDDLISLGVRAGFLDESLATDLAAVSEGSNLIRAAPGTLLRSERAAAGVRQFAAWGAYIFQKAEKLNRLQTFMASTRLEMKKGLGGRNFDNLTLDQQKALMRQSYVAGRDAIEQTMFEYARWNRPKFMRGKKSVIFLFQNFVQNMAYFAGRGPARTRFILGMLLLAGIQGLPGADDALDLIDWGATWLKQLLGFKNPKTDLRLWMREALEPLGDPDYFMHGISHNSFGMPAILDLMGIPFPSFDLSGSMSLGRIVPGLSPTLDFASPGGEFKRAFPDIVEDAGGAFVAIPMGIMEAISDDNPNNFKRIERMLPSALRNVTKAYGYATEGALRQDRSLLVPYDVNDPMHMAEIIGQSLGFMPTQISKKKALEWAQTEHGRYYEARKRILIAQFDEAIRTGDREAVQDMRKAVLAYNKQVPDRALTISGDDLEKSIHQRARNRAIRGKGLPTNRRNTRYYRNIEERFVGQED